MFTATLDCGTRLDFEAQSFLPATGDLVPCRRHGYCAVAATGSGAGRRSRCDRRAGPRTEEELLEWLRLHPATSVHALRRQGFTLRMLSAVAGQLPLDVDPASGRVLVRVRGR